MLDMTGSKFQGPTFWINLRAGVHVVTDKQDLIGGPQIQLDKKDRVAMQFSRSIMYFCWIDRLKEFQVAIGRMPSMEACIRKKLMAGNTHGISTTGATSSRVKMHVLCWVFNNFQVSSHLVGNNTLRWATARRLRKMTSYLCARRRMDTATEVGWSDGGGSK